MPYCSLPKERERERARQRDKVMLTLRMCCLSCWEERRGKVYRHMACMIKKKEIIKSAHNTGKNSQGSSKTKSYRRNTQWDLHINTDPISRGAG